MVGYIIIGGLALLAVRNSSAVKLSVPSIRQSPESVPSLTVARRSFAGNETATPLLKPKAPAILPSAAASVNPNIAKAGLTQIAPNVFAPDQIKDTLSSKIHAVASVGPTVAQQSQSLLNSQFLGFGLDASGASFSGNGSERGGGAISFDTGSFDEKFV